MEALKLPFNLKEGTMKKEEYQKLLEETKEITTSKIEKSFDELS